jgi:hypothetical protein
MATTSTNKRSNKAVPPALFSAAGETPSGKAKKVRPPAYPGDPSPDEGPVERRVLVTPEMAAEFLARPFEAITADGRALVQRARDEDTVDEYAEDMEAGDFLPTPENVVAIGVNGSLYDGQHRCAASVKSGKPFPTKICYNITPEQYEKMNQGRRRGIDTQFQIAQKANAKMLSSAVKGLHFVEAWRHAVETNDTEAQENLRYWRGWRNRRITKRRQRMVLEQHPQIEEHVAWVVENRPVEPYGVPAAAIFRYVAATAWPEGRVKLDEFCDAVFHAIGISGHQHVALTLKRWLAQERTDTQKRYAREAQLFTLIRCWNEFARDGKHLQKLPLHPGDTFPVPYRPE